MGVFIAYLVLSLMAGHPLFLRREKEREESTPPRTCPICGSLLEKGQLIKSIAFQGGVTVGNVTERLNHIFGCPFCYPVNGATPRVCPVCRRIIPADGYLIARMFERSDRERKHVHVLGCTACRKG
ncbi:MAG: hypothetical protein FWG35_02765 [Spirochaetaceae bacterium]|nr:hypothetical protein [Spirochaetaceae bacterium]